METIRFEPLWETRAALHKQFISARPFPYLVIENFLRPELLPEILAAIHSATQTRLTQSNDLVFAKEKYEFPQLEDVHPLLAQLRSEFLDPRFGEWLTALAGQNVFIDPDFVGGGVHQGGSGSYLDMHADFNLHPVNNDWQRHLNILLYLNPGWQPDMGGQLKLRSAETGNEASVEPLLNRCVIMLAQEHTLHGYAPIDFPPGTFRTSIAAYAYMHQDGSAAYRPTVWHPENAPLYRQLLARVSPTLVKLKNKWFGSRTARAARRQSR
jgi:Rps23 Pro-64 3,4-dihydroxylase Tpa1-like proline 4-hydroxylase